MPVQDIIRLTVTDLVAAVGCPEDVAALWIDPLSGSAVIHDITTPKRMVPWLATIAHESAGLTRLEENLNYSAERLTQVWPSRFGINGNADPQDYARNPEKLANYVYAGRMGNTELGDGWRYRGRGPIQLTGRDNYTACGLGIRHDIVRWPDDLFEPPVGALSAGWFWATNGLNELADEDRFEDIVRRVNGGLTGYEDRLFKLQMAKTALERFA